jgi:NIPSNAP
MRSYGFGTIATWESGMDGRTEFVYLLAWPDEETMKRAWAQFRTDKEWNEIKRLTNAKHGDLVGEIQDRVLISTSYGPSTQRAKPERS